MVEIIRKDIERVFERNSIHPYDQGYMLGFLHGLDTMIFNQWMQDVISHDEYDEMREMIWTYVDMLLED